MASRPAAAAPSKPEHTPGVDYIIDPVDGMELVSIPHAALIAQVSVRTIYNWIDRRWIQVRRRASGRLLVIAESLIRDNEVPAG